MLLDISKNAIIKAQPTVVDTLKHSLNQLQIKLDSLQKITERAEIGKEFFSDTISTNLYMFASIIGLAALISWGVIGGMLLLHKKKLEKNLNSVIAEIKKNYDDQNVSLEKNLDDTIYDVNRAMYKLTNADNDHTNAFDWALGVATISLKVINSGRKINIKFWLERTLHHLNFIVAGAQNLIDQLDANVAHLETLKNSEVEGITEILAEIKSKLYIRAYTQQSPPENLLDGNAVTPPGPITESPTEN